MFRTPYDPCPSVKHPSECQIAHERLALETRIIRYALRALRVGGYIPVQVNTGEYVENVTNESTTLEEVFSVDESTIILRAPANATREHGYNPLYRRIMVVLGNGIDCILDYSAGDPILDKIMDAVYDHFE